MPTNQIPSFEKAGVGGGASHSPAGSPYGRQRHSRQKAADLTVSFVVGVVVEYEIITWKLTLAGGGREPSFPPPGAYNFLSSTYDAIRGVVQIIEFQDSRNEIVGLG